MHGMMLHCLPAVCCRLETLSIFTNVSNFFEVMSVR